MKSFFVFTVFVGLFSAGCGSPTPVGMDGGIGDGGGGGGDLAFTTCNPGFTEDVSTCMPLSTDYQPRQGMPGANGWTACISDDNTYHLLGTGLPAAAARSMTFDAMAPLLWANPKAPTKDDFLNARDAYSIAEGLASRVARRQDIHYAEVPGGDLTACSMPSIQATYPDRCAGPAKLKPMIDDAFVKGIGGTQPVLQAKRIEAAVLWFLYLSPLSEVWTSGWDDINDVDSAAGYYTAVSERGKPVGLAKYVATLGPETHNRVYDGLLAARCWRDIDKSFPASDMFKNFYTLASNQLDKALLRGLALILRDRIGKVGCSTGDEQLGQLAFVNIIGKLMDRAARAVDATKADQLLAQTQAATPDKLDVKAAQALLDGLFSCP